MERKLASIRRIDALQPIEGADRIELAIVGGWKVVVKKGDYQVNSLAVYLEIDSFVPNSIAPFLTKSGHYPKVYQGVEGQRLKTIKLKGQISQGLLLPLSVIGVTKDQQQYDSEGLDVTEILGILKWEKEIPLNMQGQVRGNFPSLIPKTSQERVQNISKKQWEQFQKERWVVTEKLHGMSATFMLDENRELHVCSRNIDLKHEEGNTYWEVAIENRIHDKLKVLAYAMHDYVESELKALAIQGEIIGPGINGNQYGLTKHEFRVFHLYDATHGYATQSQVEELCELIGLVSVPVLAEEFTFDSIPDVETLLLYADGKSVINGSTREGVVFDSLDSDASFKVVSNKWLLEGGEE